MSSTLDGVTFIVQIYRIGASATDNLIQAINNSGNWSQIPINSMATPGMTRCMAKRVAISCRGRMAFGMACGVALIRCLRPNPNQPSQPPPPDE